MTVERLHRVGGEETEREAGGGELGMVIKEQHGVICGFGTVQNLNYDNIFMNPSRR